LRKISDSMQSLNIPVIYQSAMNCDYLFVSILKGTSYAPKLNYARFQPSTSNRPCPFYQTRSGSFCPKMNSATISVTPAVEAGKSPNHEDLESALATPLLSALRHPLRTFRLQASAVVQNCPPRQPKRHTRHNISHLSDSFPIKWCSTG
jgi:hypothetical protein